MSLKDERLVTVEGRVAFVKNLFNPNKKGRFTLAVVFDKDEKSLKGYDEERVTLNAEGEEEVEIVHLNGVEDIRNHVNALIAEKWGDKAPNGLKRPLKEENRPDMLESYPFMENRVTLNASNGFPVGVGELDENGYWVDLEEKDLKAGDYVQIAITGYQYDNETKGVGLNIQNVKKTKSGEAFYSRRSGADMFGAKTQPQQGQAGFDNFGF